MGKKQGHCMDSVFRDTPKIMKEKENINILRVDEIVEEKIWYKNDYIITQWGFKDFGDWIIFESMDKFWLGNY